MLSRPALGIGLSWFVLLCAAAWIWGQTGDGGQDALFATALSALAIVCVVWGAVLIREGRGRWILWAVALGAFIGAVVAIVSGATTDVYSSDGPYLGLAMLVVAVFLAVPLARVAVGYLWRYEGIAAVKRAADGAKVEDQD